VSAFLWVFLPLLLAFELTLRWCWDLWWTKDWYFAHGPLVPLVMALVFWRRRAQWRRRPAALDHRAWWLLGPALFVHLCGAALTIDSLSAVALALAVPGAAWLALGSERLRGQWPALWLFAFAVPLPMYVTGQVVVRLKEIAIGGGVAIARFAGQLALPDRAPLVVRGIDGLHIAGQDGALFVADACSGLRSLLAMVTLAYVVAFFLGPRQPLRLAVLLALAAPFALGVNVVRIAVICLLARAFGIAFASGDGHTLANVCAFALNFGLLMGVDWLVTRQVEAPAPLPDPVPSLLTPPRPLRRVGVLLWCTALPLLLLSETRPYTQSSGRARQLPVVAGAYTLRTSYDHELGPNTFQLLGTDDVTWRGYGIGNEVCYVVAVFHTSNWKSVHPPHVCLLGSDMDIVVDDTVPLGDDAGTRVGRIELSTKQKRPYVCLYAYGARDLCTASYAAFFLHHAPRALFRASNDGFLLRVEAFGDGEGGIAGAEQRCRDLLRELVAEARGLLP